MTDWAGGENADAAGGPSLSAQAAAAELAAREVRLDTRGGRMRPSERALQAERLEAAAKTLRWLERNEAAVRAAVAGDAAQGRTPC